MKFNNKKVSDINIAYIGGGSRGWAWGLMSDLALEESISGTVKLYDINLDAAKTNEVIGNIANKTEGAKSDWKYEAVETLGGALKGADFVIISILPGTLEEMRFDVELPKEYGIYQSVGDTVGAGGLVRALRTLPMYEVMADAIKENCPEAWVINYTNPMTLCTRMLYSRFPQIKAFGCCHEVFGVQRILAYALKEFKEIENVDRRDIKTNVLGINHFTWIDKATYNGEDLFPLYAKLAEKYGETGIEGIEKNHWINSVFKSNNRVKFDLFKRYGIIAAAGDRHLAEFCPPWYLKDPQTAEKWGFRLTTIDVRYSLLEEKLEKSKNLVELKEMFEFKETGEDGIKQIKALLGLEDFVANVNIPNVGQINNLPLEAVVETNALFTKNKIEPVFAGGLPEEVNILVARHVANQELILKACVERDLSKAFMAFLNEPLTNLDINTAKELFDKMIDGTKDYLDGYKFK